MQNVSSVAPKSFQCNYVRASGRRCGCASLRGEQFCYYHYTTRRPGTPSQAALPHEAGFDQTQPAFHLHSLEDRASVQIAVKEVMNRLAAGTIDVKLASLLLYGLQLASNNLQFAHKAVGYTSVAPIAELRDVHSLPSARARRKDHTSDAIESFLKAVALEMEQYERELRNPTPKRDDEDAAGPARRPN